MFSIQPHLVSTHIILDGAVLAPVHGLHRVLPQGHEVKALLLTPTSRPSTFRRCGPLLGVREQVPVRETLRPSSERREECYRTRYCGLVPVRVGVHLHLLPKSGTLGFLDARHAQLCPGALHVDLTPLHEAAAKDGIRLSSKQNK